MSFQDECLLCFFLQLRRSRLREAKHLAQRQRARKCGNQDSTVQTFHLLCCLEYIHCHRKIHFLIICQLISLSSLQTMTQPKSRAWERSQRREVWSRDTVKTFGNPGRRGRVVCVWHVHWCPDNDLTLDWGAFGWHRELVNRSLAKESYTLSPILQILFKCPKHPAPGQKGREQRKTEEQEVLRKLLLSWCSYHAVAVVSLQYLNGPESKFLRSNGNQSKWQRQLEGATAGQVWDSLNITTSSGRNVLNHRIK